MTVNDWANAQEENEHECLNCGRTLPLASGDVEACGECCDHENVREELTCTVCLDCGAHL